ncbi:MAG: peptide/nickel transport system ATP-binding protein [Gammaproteobacteria bacterium]|jgi:peptide/nickel transport system ATP-binding protein
MYDCEETMMTSLQQPKTGTSIAPVSAMDPRDRGGNAQPMLIAQKLKKHFPITGGIFNRTVGHVRAVDGVSFHVLKGETLGVVGESGCGKSTLARLLMHLIVPDEGKLIFDGDEVGSETGLEVRDMRRLMQMVFQDSYSSLNPRMPVEDSVAYGMTVHGASDGAAKQAARELLEKVGLDPSLFGPRYPHELSGGQKQRVNIARALVLEPRVVILDEAVSALDKSVEAQVLNLLQRLKRHFNLTYVFISHDLNVVQYVSDRVLVMYLGEVVELGEVDDIYARPQHPYTQALLGSRLSMNPADRIYEPPLVGDPPNPINPPSGCRFRSRCQYAEAICETQTPALVPIAGPGSTTSRNSGHSAACHIRVVDSGHSLSGTQSAVGTSPKSVPDSVRAHHEISV